MQKVSFPNHKTRALASSKKNELKRDEPECICFLARPKGSTTAHSKVQIQAFAAEAA